MFLLSNKKNNYFIKFFIISLILIFIQSYMPKIWIFEEFDISIDFFLIFLTLIVLNHEVYLVIICAFALGLFQDFVIQINMIGSYALIKPFAIYFIGMLKNFKHLWTYTYKIFYLFIIYFLHFMIYYYIMVNNSFFIICILSLIQSFICLLLFYIFEKLFYNSQVL